LFPCAAEGGKLRKKTKLNHGKNIEAFTRQMWKRIWLIKKRGKSDEKKMFEDEFCGWVNWENAWKISL
jgi:hypothetical protein